MSIKIAEKSFHHPILLLLLIASIAGCSDLEKQPTEVSQIVTPAIQVIPSGEPPEKRVISSETIPQNNCGGSAGVSSTIERSRSIVFTLDLGAEISVNASGSAGVPGIGEVQVGAKVAAKYGVSYGQEETLSRSLTVSAKEGTNILHTLQQVEYWETGELVIVAGEKSLSYPYSFRKDFGVEHVKSENMGCPSLTPTPTPTSTPESECPQGLNCYRSDFDELDPTLFCTTPQSGYELQMGQLIVTAKGDTTNEIKPCEPLGWNLRFVELTLAIEQMSGKPGHAFAGIGVSLSKDRYSYLQLDSGGNALVKHGLGGNSSQIDATIPLNGIGTPHKLRVEFNGKEATFFIDDAQIDAKITSEGFSDWFLLDVSAWPGASITAKLDEVIWGVVP
jgi:hypothetical protein